jgi:hypothetical protein
MNTENCPRHPLLIALLLIALLLTSCNFPTPTLDTKAPCEVDELVAPILIEPEDGATVNASESLAGSRPTFRWHYPGACEPDGFQILIASDPDFTSFAHIEESEEWSDTYDLPIDLEPESQYYWRVAVLMWGEGGGRGPFSEERTFYTRGVLEGQPGVISGMVWDDACANPDPRNDYPPDLEPPFGCIRVGDAIVANGRVGIHEHGISGVTVRIAQGACVPGLSTEGAVASSGPTDEDGRYYYYAPPGTYCVYIDICEEANNEILMPGVFSAPTPLGSALRTVTIEEDGQIIEGISFGWDYDLDTGLERASVSGKIGVDADSSGSLEPDEPGIPNLEVWLSRGPCDPDWSNQNPGVDLTTRTDQDGMFGAQSTNSDTDAWTSLDLGTYCVVVDMSDRETAVILDRGYWTFPIEGDAFPAHTIYLDPDMSLWLEFGWHFPPYFIPDDSANCRSGPSTVYATLSYVTDGEQYWLIGKNESETWWQTEAGCWVADSIGTMIGDPNELPVVNVPLPTETPTSPPPPPTATPTPSDTVNPLVHCTASSDSVPRGGNNTLSASASDNVGVKTITIYVQAPGASKFNPVKICQNLTICADTSSYTVGGTYNYYAVAADAADNTGTSLTHSFYVYEP